MIKFICNKLGRDKDLELFEKSGISVQYKLANKDEFIVAIHKKLLEEALEVVQATNRQEIIAELGDILEVIDAFKKTYQIAEQEIISAKNLKFLQKGGYEKGIFIESITMDDSNPRVSHFRASPDKYLEDK